MFIDIAVNPCYYEDDNGQLDLLIFDSLIERAKFKQVMPIFIGMDNKTNKLALELAYQYKTYCYVGIHPNHVYKIYQEGKDVDSEIQNIKNMIQEDLNKEKRIVGIGECGLDSFRCPENIEQQIFVFKKILKEFIEYNLPFLFHIREPPVEINSVPSNSSVDEKVKKNENVNSTSGDDKKKPTTFDTFVEILNQYKSEIRGVVHSFTGSVEDAKRILEFKNLMIGINGVSMRESVKVVAFVDLNRILLETDSPFCLMRRSWEVAKYLSPKDFIKSRNNEPSYIGMVCLAVAKIKQVSPEEVEEVTYKNTVKLFFKDGIQKDFFN